MRILKPVGYFQGLLELCMMSSGAQRSQRLHILRPPAFHVLRPLGLTLIDSTLEAMAQRLSAAGHGPLKIRSWGATSDARATLCVPGARMS